MAIRWELPKAFPSLGGSVTDKFDADGSLGILDYGSMRVKQGKQDATSGIRNELAGYAGVSFSRFGGAAPLAFMFLRRFEICD